MENIRYRPIDEVIPPTTPVSSYPYWKSPSLIVPPEKYDIPVPIAFETRMEFDRNPYYEIISEGHFTKLADTLKIS